MRSPAEVAVGWLVATMQSPATAGGRATVAPSLEGPFTGPAR
jgi:hypothetical protein